MVRDVAAEPASQSWTFAMVDLAGYAALTETHGDEQAADLATLFADLARTALGPQDRLVKPIGDAVLLAAPDPAAGLGLVRRLLAACSELEGFPLVRAGLHHGPAAERAGDMFGTAVNTAARIAGQASGGQVLATEEVATAAATSGLSTVSIGSLELRNLTAPLELFAIELGPARPAGSIDPVCRMWVDRSKAAGQLRHEGHDYWFCSLACAARFAASPDAYTGPARRAAVRCGDRPRAGRGTRAAHRRTGRRSCTPGRSRSRPARVCRLAGVPRFRPASHRRSSQLRSRQSRSRRCHANGRLLRSART